MSEDHPHGDRLSRIETAIGSLTATVDGLAKVISRHESRLEAVESANSSRGKVDWQAYGFILAFVGAVGYMAKEPMDYRINDNAQAVRDLDETLQREMRLLDSALEGEITHLAEGREENRSWLVEHETRLTRLETLAGTDSRPQKP